MDAVALKKQKNKELGIMSESKYDESFPERAMDFAAVGLTDRQIALKMDISRSSFYNYKQQHPDFAEAIEWGRELVDGKV